MTHWALDYFESKTASLAEWNIYAKSNPIADGRTVNFSSHTPRFERIVQDNLPPKVRNTGPSLTQNQLLENHAMKLPFLQVAPHSFVGSNFPTIMRKHAWAVDYLEGNF